MTKLVSVSREGQVLTGSCALAKERYPTHSGEGWYSRLGKKNQQRTG